MTCKLFKHNCKKKTGCCFVCERKDECENPCLNSPHPNEISTGVCGYAKGIGSPEWIEKHEKKGL
jgi:hypothetical protein